MDERPAFTDSPWFWAYLFAVAALIALALIGPKYSLRQLQIERQFAGRQRAAQGDAAPAAIDRVTDGEPTRVTLQPLFFGLAMVTMLLWLVHWRTTLRRPPEPASKP